MNDRIYLWDLFDKEETPEAQKKTIPKNPYYDLSPIPSPKVQEEMAAFIKWRSTQVCAASVYSDRQYYKKVCRFLQESVKPETSLLDKTSEAWVRQFKMWMFKEQIPLYEKQSSVACNRQSSLEKIDLAKKTIFEMLEDGEKITIPKLIAKTGLSRGFFYKNPIVRSVLDKALEQQVGMTDLRKNILDMAMDNEIAALHEKIRALQAENERLKKALNKKNASLIRSL